MFGIWTSEIKHEVSVSCSECKNERAEEKACATKPSDRTRLAVPIRLDSSSSTIEITGVSRKRLAHQCVLYNALGHLRAIVIHRYEVYEALLSIKCRAPQPF